MVNVLEAAEMDVYLSRKLHLIARRAKCTIHHNLTRAGNFLPLAVSGL